MKRTWICMAAVAGVALCAALASGQETQPAAAKLGEGRGQVVLTWDEFV